MQRGKQSQNEKQHLAADDQAYQRAGTYSIRTFL